MVLLVLDVRFGTGGEAEDDVLIPRRVVAGTTNADDEDRKADEKVAGAKPMVRSSRYIHSKIILWREK